MSFDMVFPSSNNGRLKVSFSALTTMMTHLQVKVPLPEAGGVLIGRLIVGSRDIIVDSVTEPQPKDRRSRNRIDRCDPTHQLLVDAAFEHSGGTYLGEWHTHPEPHPLPSNIDLKNWRRKGKNDIYYGEGLIFIILGTESLGIWQGYRGSRKISLIGKSTYPPLIIQEEKDADG